MRIWIKDYSTIARPLVNLTRKDAEFVWTVQHQEAMKSLKTAIANLPALIPIDYTSTRPCIWLPTHHGAPLVGSFLSSVKMARGGTHASGRSAGMSAKADIRNRKSSSMASSGPFVPFVSTLSVLLTSS
jgi:hypothetical protein